MNNRRNIKVYVAGPIQGATLLDSLANIEHGLMWTARVFQLGFSPFPVFSDASFIQKVRPIPPMPDVYNYSLAWLRKSDVLFATIGWEKSPGCLNEMKVARECNIPIVYDLNELCAWADRMSIDPIKEAEAILGMGDD